MHELTFVLPVVVCAQEQFAVPAIGDENAEQDVGLGAAPIAAINRRKNYRFHVMPPCEANAPDLSCIDYGGRT
jgi:hypothetical protein